MRHLLLLSLVLALLVTPVPRAGEAQAVLNPAYFLTDLGTLGGAESEARAVNNHGEVVGWAETGASDSSGKPIRRAFVWCPVNGTSDLGTTGGPRSEANDINDGGQVVGWSEIKSRQREACEWREGQVTALTHTTIIDSPWRGSTWSWTEARAVSNAGHIVGRLQISDRFAAAEWTPRGIRVLRHADDGSAEAVNSNGKIVGWGLLSTTHGSSSFSWPGMHLITGLPARYYRNHRDRAYDINETGAIVGGGGGGGPYLRWQVTFRLASLTGPWSTLPLALNERREVVGTYWDWQREAPYYVNFRACRWDKGRVTDLNDHLLPGTGWVLEQANDINERGQIVGVGRVGPDGTRRAFLLTPRS